MKSLVDILLEHRDAIGHELKIGDFIQFDTTGFMVYGQIQDITDDDKPKYIVKSLGWIGDKSLKDKVKPEYKVNANAKHVFQINIDPKFVTKLKEEGIIK